MNRTTRRVAVAITLACGAALIVVPGAQAFTAAEPELTVTQQTDFPEGGTIQMTLECPTGSGYGEIIVAPTASTLFPPLPYDDPVDGTGKVSWIVNLEGLTAGEPYDAPAGMNVFFTGKCYTDSSMTTQVGSADTAQILVPDWGMIAAAPSQVALDVPIPVTADCGTTPTGFVPNYFEIVVYDTDGTTPLAAPTTVSTPGPITGYQIGTPASYGFANGDDIKLLVLCIGSYNGSPDDVGASRYTTLTAGGRLNNPGGTPADPADPTPVDSLAFTGASYTLVPFAVLLIAAGALLIVDANRRRSLGR